MDYLNQCYNYQQIIKKIDNKERINKNERNIDINEIIKQIPEPIKNDIYNKDKKYDMSLFKSFEKNIKEDGQEVFYYDDCILINENIKNILMSLNGINF